MVIVDESTNLSHPNGGGFTVNWKLVFVLNWPSLTDKVMVAVAVSPNAGVTVTYHLPNAVPKKIFSTGTNTRFDEDPVRRRLSTVVSGSLKVSGIASVG